MQRLASTVAASASSCRIVVASHRRRIVVVASSRRRRRLVVASSSLRLVVVAVSSRSIHTGIHKSIHTGIHKSIHKCIHTGIHKSPPLSPPESLPPGPHHQSGRRAVVSSLPVSVLTAILTAILTGILTLASPPLSSLLGPHHHVHCWSSCSRVIRPRYPHLYPHCNPHPPSPPPVLVGALSCHAVPAHPHQNITAILPAVLVVAQSCDPLSSPPSSPLSSTPRPSPPVLVVVSSVPAATLTSRSPAPPPQTRDGGQTVRTWVAAARPGAAAIVKAGHCSEGCKVFGGCSHCEGTWQRWAGRSGPRPPSSLPSLRTQAWTFAMMPGAPPARFQGL